MPYTLWSHDRLLGQSDLDYMQIRDRHVIGDFEPTTLGESLMPLVTGETRALLDFARTSRENHGRYGFSEGYEGMQRTTEYADLAAARTHRESLELQLRAPDGSLVPTEWIDVRDIELLLSLIDEDEDTLESEPYDPELEAAIEHDVALIEEWFADEESGDQGWDAEPDTEEDSWQERRSMPRYQIQVLLAPEARLAESEKTCNTDDTDSTEGAR